MTEIQKVKMKNKVKSFDYTFLVILGSIVILSVSRYSVEADEVPAFFLKIAKNIPRVGRSDKFDDLFLNSGKNVHETGKHDDNTKVYLYRRTYTNNTHVYVIICFLVLINYYFIIKLLF